MQNISVAKNCQNKTTNFTLYWHPVLVQSCKPNSKNAGLGLHSTAGCMLHNISWDEQIVPSVGSTRRAPKTQSRCSSSWPCTLRKTLSNAHSHGQTKFSHVGRQHKYWNISTLGQTYTQAQNHRDKTKIRFTWTNSALQTQHDAVKEKWEWCAWCPHMRCVRRSVAALCRGWTL